MPDYTAFLRFGSDSRDIRKSDKDLESLEKQSYKTEKAASAMGKALGRAFAGISVGLVARQIIKSTAEQERVTAQLNQTLRSTRRYSDETSEALLAHAAALQQVTTFGDEAVISAQSQLLMFTKLGSEVFPRATESVLDLAEKMDGDLRGAVIQVGKALNNPVRGIEALTRSGIQFTDAQKDQIKEMVKGNDLLGAQKIILGELETRFGGSARAARDTFGGALKAVQNALGDLLEADGDSLPGAIDALNELTDTLNDPDIKRGFANLTSSSITATGWLAKLAAGAANLTVAFGEDVAIALNGGRVAMDDFQRRAEIIVDLERQLAAHQDSLNTAGPNSSFARAVRADIAALEEKIRLQRESLTADLQDAAFSSKRKSGGGTSIPGLDGDLLEPVVVNAKKREAELSRIMDQIRNAIKDKGEAAARDLDDTLKDLAGTVGGPVVEANIRYSDTMAMLAQRERELANAGLLSIERQQQLASARGLATQALQEELDALEAERLLEASKLTRTEEILAQLADETYLMTLSDKEREIAITQRYAEVDAMSAQGQAIAILIGQIQKEREAVQLLDEVRASTADALASVIDGTKSAGDAWDGYLKRLRSVVAQILAEKLIEKILGNFGGSDGGAFGSILTSIFGGGRASGGNVMAGRLYEVTEQGTELLRMGNRQFLIPGQDGHITPNHQITNKSNTNNTRVTVLVAPEERRKTAAQLGNQTARQISRHQARNS